MTYIVLIISVFIGALIVQAVKELNANAIKLLLAFSGAYLFAISVFHLLPEVYSDGNKTVGIFILLGFILQIILEFFSQGIEHGHTHIHNKAIPISMLISLAIHAYLEGMPLADVNAHGHTHHFQDSLLTGIAIHKIPVTIVLMSLFAQAGYSKMKVFWFYCHLCSYGTAWDAFRKFNSRTKSVQQRNYGYRTWYFLTHFYHHPLRKL